MRLIAASRPSRAGRAVAVAPGLADPLGDALGPLDEAEIDLRRCQIDANHLHPRPIGETIAGTGALACQFMASFVEVKVVGAEIGDVHQPLDEDVVEGHEQSERYHRRNTPLELLTDLVLHVETLEPRDNVPRGIVGAPLGLRAMQADRIPVSRRLLLSLDRRLDRAVHEQIGIAPDR